MELDGLKKVRLYVQGQRYAISLPAHIADTLIRYTTTLDYDEKESEEFNDTIRDLIGIEATVDLVLDFIGDRLLTMLELGMMPDIDMVRPTGDSESDSGEPRSTTLTPLTGDTVSVRSLADTSMLMPLTQDDNLILDDIGLLDDEIDVIFR